MNIGVLGTGIVGRTIAARLVELNHAVVLGTRDPEKTLAQTEPDRMGNPPLNFWLKQNPKVSLGSFAESAGHGGMVFNATNGNGTLDALNAAGEAQLGGKILVDISNPLDFSNGMPPTLFVSNTDSLAEQIQRAFPNVKVVKTLNTVTANLMVHPRQLQDGSHSVFVSGNDPDAKTRVSDLLRSFGWIDIIDLGNITTARGAEMYLPIWLSLWGALGTGMINVRVAR
jgi:8-hydroxy-5-deazaflavin:NADPH oxidoreductase